MSRLLPCPPAWLALVVLGLTGCDTSWTVSESTEAEGVEVAPGAVLERQVVYGGVGGYVAVVARLEAISPPDARLRIRQIDGDLPSCEEQGVFDAPVAGEALEMKKQCSIAGKSDRTIFIENLGPQPVRFVYRTRGEIHVEQDSSSGSERVEITELRRGMAATPRK